MTNAADNPGHPTEASSGDPPEATPGQSAARQHWAAIGRWLIPIVVLVVLALLLYGFVFREGPVASIAGLFGSDGGGYATGFVEIDTPEVYTRERLVNDRFVEDTWLKELLSSSATKRSLPSLSIADSNRRGAEVRAAVSSAADGGQSPAPSPESPAPQANGGQPPSAAAPDSSAAVLDNILAFKADQLYRQTIRQAIIENQLDDTHDLRGNSLYLFKFDASVLPTEANKRQLRIDMELSNRTSVHAPFTMSDFIQRNSPNAAISDAEGIYELWLQGVNAKLERLRAELRQAFNRATIGDDFSNDVKTEFRQRFGFPLAGDASNPDALLAALKGEGDRIMRKLKPRHGAAGSTPELERARGFAEAFAKRTADDCSFLDQISSEESEGAADGEDVPATSGQLGAEGAQQDPTAEADVEATLGDVRRCLSDFVITNWAMRLNFGTNGSSTGGTRSVWDYVRPVYRSGGAVDFQRRIDFYLVSFPSLMGECFKQEECMQTLGGYQFVGSYDLDDSQKETLKTAIAATAQRAECGDFKLADTPTSVIIYGLPGQKSGAVATPLPLDALSEILRKGSYSCSFKDDPLTGFHVNFERGLFNFIESIRERSRGYSYSVMPREDLQIVAREFDSGQSFKAGGGGRGVSGELSEERKRAARAVEGEATIVGFGSTRSVGMPAAGGADADGALEFGWIIWPGLRFDASGAPVYQQVPMQKSLSALVSIPAWWERVHICGRYEWLDTKREASNREQRFEDLRDLCKHSKAGTPPRDTASPAPAGAAATTESSDDTDDNSFEYDVSLPFEIGSLDPVLFRQSRPADPKMFPWSMGAITLTICEPASIIIPGQRLWRSAVVTVGSQQANEIIVLPNMEGIIAKFNRIEFPNGAGTPESSGSNTSAVGNILAAFNPLKPVALTVWTSEGSVQYDLGVNLAPPSNPDGSLSKATSCDAVVRRTAPSTEAAALGGQ